MATKKPATKPEAKTPAKAAAKAPAKAATPKPAPAKAKAPAKAPAKPRKAPAKAAPKAAAPEIPAVSAAPALALRVEAVRMEQLQEGHFDCFAKAYDGYCDQMECRYREECLDLSRRITA